MAATEKMRIYAIIIAIAMELPFPDFEDFDATREFIAEHEMVYRALLSKFRSAKREEAKAYFYAVYDLESLKMRLKTGNWVTKMFSKKKPPFNSLETLNAANRI
ncbi:hypothetical protein EAL2_c13890 [Peptoclostridium acidaminophilum DSM 3953]|uniref:Uncharacterized protein n=1 Tax=Peptoclostridium acidaminophilum DSM 3953 TaxID=1286171 RepID=W8T4L2_PEPAC|nr:hypothetical protein [Peptoclostridium acidaminophilum]AHM56684.1 hypothetical protein EAL2_c13890 [Peptoclostridium acidaminophilum DSM 3953]